ncbi:hypothetical protein A2304_01770 [Candidatus Uhrbacteria bacterium RIFOXYB2_FULL_57_15]|uniref:Uncharacterized protein n=1 Tax=Candidatus Uhrbacteria bacterium RIFOXYB2_FULL_57_15 TaxID=1802422 RepID=A0A1F7W8I5_9BACT|nr:MAG: hypothetical protein A2304_01770 [Candidatus Uhrbacteria bacterium RIFOXYB2_FULL_57_15]
MAFHSHDDSQKTRMAWVVDVNMGYGHSRAAHALRGLSGGTVISANDYRGIPASDRRVWKDSRRLYEVISRLKPVPVVGQFLFEALDHWQQIPSFYPRRDLSDPNMQLTQMYRLIHKGWGRHLIGLLSKDPVPFVTTFFAAAFFADYFDYPGEIYCVTTDADISRTWAALDPKKSRIRYFASNGRVVERLKLYGVPEKNIILTGFPMPKELIGGARAPVLKDLLAARLCNLDPDGIFHERYQRILRTELGPARCGVLAAGHPLTLTYSVGGAGAQRQLGVQVLQSLRKKISRHEIRLNLVAGTRKDVASYYQRAAADLGLKKQLGEWLVIPTFESRPHYFEGFNDLLKTTDVLWTKPSELSFYTGLGIAVVMAPPIGSQEEFNRIWLQYMGGGVAQNDPRYANEWLFDWIHSGGVARMAWNGYVEAPTHGTYRIEDVVLGQPSEIHPLPLIV